MPNHLTDPPVVKELIQDQATKENLIAEVSRLLMDDHYFSDMQQALAKIRPMLTVDSGELACDAIEVLIASKAAK